MGGQLGAWSVPGLQLKAAGFWLLCLSLGSVPLQSRAFLFGWWVFLLWWSRRFSASSSSLKSHLSSLGVADGPLSLGLAATTAAAAVGAVRLNDPRGQLCLVLVVRKPRRFSNRKHESASQMRGTAVQAGCSPPWHVCSVGGGAAWGRLAVGAGPGPRGLHLPWHTDEQHELFSGDFLRWRWSDLRTTHA